MSSSVPFVSFMVFRASAPRQLLAAVHPAPSGQKSSWMSARATHSKRRCTFFRGKSALGPVETRFRTGKRPLRRPERGVSDGKIGFQRKKELFPNWKTSFSNRPSMLQAPQARFARGKDTFWENEPSPARNGRFQAGKNVFPSFHLSVSTSGPWSCLEKWPRSRRGWRDWGGGGSSWDRGCDFSWFLCPPNRGNLKPQLMQTGGVGVHSVGSRK